MKLSSFAVHHPNSLMSYAIPLALHRQEMLFKMFADCYTYSWMKPYLEKIDSVIFGDPQIYKNSLKRSSSLPDSMVSSLVYKGYMYNLIRSKTKDYISQLKLGFLISEAIADKIKKQIGHFDAVYCFALCASDCRSAMPDVPIVMDQMHIPLKNLIRIIELEEIKYSDWLNTSGNVYKSAKQELLRKEQQDVCDADLVIAPSEFVKDCLVNTLGLEKNKVLLLPYPAPAWLYNHQTSLADFDSKPQKTTHESDKIRIIFVGEIGIRKGIPVLLQALRKLDKTKFEARLVGTINISSIKIREYADICTFMGKLNKAELSVQYQWADLFVFPSLGEGSAGVIYEAMAFGLPVITTFSSGSHVRNDIEGYIVPEGDIDALVDKINLYIEDRDRLTRHSLNSWTRVKDFSLEQTSIRFRETFMQIQN